MLFYSDAFAAAVVVEAAVDLVSYHDHYARVDADARAAAPSLAIPPISSYLGINKSTECKNPQRPSFLHLSPSPNRHKVLRLERDA